MICAQVLTLLLKLKFFAKALSAFLDVAVFQVCTGPICLLLNKFVRVTYYEIVYIQTTTTSSRRYTKNGHLNLAFVPSGALVASILHCCYCALTAIDISTNIKQMGGTRMKKIETAGWPMPWRQPSAQQRLNM